MLSVLEQLSDDGDSSRRSCTAGTACWLLSIIKRSTFSNSDYCV